MSKKARRNPRDRHDRKRFAMLNKMIADGYVIDNRGKLVHRQVCRQAHGPYPSDWVVHHIDHNRKNNTPSNLIALPRSLHDSIHKVMRRDKTIWDRSHIEQALRAWRGLAANSSRQINITVVFNNDASKSDDRKQHESSHRVDETTTCQSEGRAELSSTVRQSED